jgi:hypothetical protein
MTEAKPKRGETFGEAQARVKKVLTEMALDRKGHWLTRIWATWQLVRLRAAERRQDKALRQFFEQLLGRKL